jgi:hypothetical protein
MGPPCWTSRALQPLLYQIDRRPLKKDTGWSSTSIDASTGLLSPGRPGLELEHAGGVMSWQESWDDGSRGERGMLDRRPVEQLLADVEDGHYGQYYGIWYSIAERATLEQAGLILFEVLCRGGDYLNRYHCATALLRLLGDSTRTAPQLCLEHPGRLDELVSLERELRARLGG